MEKSKESIGRRARILAAWVLIGIGTAILVALLSYGGPIFPHVAGPIVLLGAGTALLLIKRKGGAK